MDGDILPLVPRSANQSANENQNQGVSLTSNISKKSSAQHGDLQASVPSGLRMPSPKIGFFDGVSFGPSLFVSIKISIMNGIIVLHENMHGDHPFIQNVM